jgi:GntR family transcriptional regulator/MocR family aminotransferase
MARTTGWADLYAWHVDRASEIPLFRQIYLEIRGAILSQTLRRGTKLPSTRELALRIGVSRASVVAAYEQLLDEGYISGRIGSGSYISFDPPEPFARKAADRGKRRPSAPLAATTGARTLDEFPESTAACDERAFNTGRTLVDARTVDTWRKLTHRALRSLGSGHLGYSDPRGFMELRGTVRDYLRAARGVQCEAEQIIITSGTQQGVDITIRALLHPGDEVWVEDPGYPLIRYALTTAGIKMRAIRVDSAGLNVGNGMRWAPRARAAFVTPSHQFPTGVVLSMARRLELLGWARETGAWIIEDDYASEYRYSGRPLASLQGLDEAERVIYIGTLNKVLFPGLRIGFAVVPWPLLHEFVNLRYVMDRQPPSIEQLVLAEFMRDGYFAAHLRRTRARYHEQRDALVAALNRRLQRDMSVVPPDQGIHLVAYLRNGLTDVDVEEAARRDGVVVRAISRLYLRAPKRSGLLLGFSGYPRPVIIPAVARLAQVLGKQRSQGRRALATT